MLKRNIATTTLPIAFNASCMCPTAVHDRAQHRRGVSRGFFTLSAGALLAASPALMSLPALARESTPGLARQRSGTYSFTLGQVEITALSDGTVPLDLHQLLLGTTTMHVDALLRSSFLANPIEVSINEWVFRLGNRVVLVETGTGGLFGPGFGGSLPDSLTAAGYRPENVTDVLITHLHPDHYGGLMRSGAMVFPNATIHVGEPDLAFFLERSNATTSHYDLKYFDEAITTLKPYIDSGKVKTFGQTAEISRGLTAEIHAGHTPGSAFYTLTSDGQTIVFVGDIAHVAAVQFPDPAIAINFDVDPKAAVAVRERFFPVFVRDRSLLAVPHMPFPGVGHIRSLAHGFEWIPSAYVNRRAV